jgi:hypothetical protein
MLVIIRFTGQQALCLIDITSQLHPFSGCLVANGHLQSAVLTMPWSL